MKMAQSMLLVAALVVFTVAEAQPPFAVSPTNVTTTFNATATFTCILDENIPMTRNLTAIWKFNNGTKNGTKNETKNFDIKPQALFNVSLTMIGIMEFRLTINTTIANPEIILNGTIVFCMTASRDPNITLVEPSRSKEAYLFIQGQLHNVKINYTRNKNSIHFFWDPPYSLILTNSSLGTKYCVSIIHNTTSSKDHNEDVNSYVPFLHPRLSNDTFYNYTFPETSTSCDVYELKVITFNGPLNKLVDGKIATMEFFRSEAPLNNSDVTIEASFINGIYEAKMFLNSDDQVCNDSCEADARSSDGVLHHLNASNGLTCYSNTVTLTVNTSSENLLNLHQSYTFNAFIKNAAGTGNTTDTILFISEDIVRAKVEEFSTSLLVTATFSTTSNSIGTIIFLRQQVENQRSKEETCAKGIETRIARRNGNIATGHFNYLSEGKYELMLLPLNELGHIMITKNGSLAAKFFNYTSIFSVNSKLGDGCQQSKSTKSLHITNTDLDVSEFRNNKILIILQSYSSTNKLSLKDLKIVYSDGEKSQINVGNFNTSLCVSIYYSESDNTYIGAQRVWTTVNLHATSLNTIAIVLIVIIPVFAVCLIITVISIIAAIFICNKKRRSNKNHPESNLAGIRNF